MMASGFCASLWLLAPVWKAARIFAVKLLLSLLELVLLELVLLELPLKLKPE
jgi:hypothetical protein